MEKGKSEREALLKVCPSSLGRRERVGGGGGESIELEEALEERRLNLYCLFIYPK